MTPTRLTIAATLGTLVLALAACQSAPPATSTTATGSAVTSPLPGASAVGPTDLLAKLQALTESDATASEADAVANSDQISEPCYPAIGKWAESLNANPLAAPPAGAGVMYLQQRIRDAASQSSSLAVPAYVKVGCAALFIDDATFLAKLDAFLAGAVATGGASVIPSLGLTPALPITVAPNGITITAPVP